MISFLVGRKNGPRVEIPKPPQRKSQKNLGAKSRKALKSKDFRKYLNWSYTPEEPAAFQPKSGGFLRPVNSVSCAVGFKKALDVYRIYIQAKWRVAVKNDGGSVKRKKSPLKRST